MFREVIDNEIYPYTKISKNFGFMPKIVYACQLGVISNTEIDGTEVKSNSLGLTLQNSHYLYILKKIKFKKNLHQKKHQLKKRNLMKNFKKTLWKEMKTNDRRK